MSAISLNTVPLLFRSALSSRWFIAITPERRGTGGV